jgi:hypothetical protein
MDIFLILRCILAVTFRSLNVGKRKKRVTVPFKTRMKTSPLSQMAFTGRNCEIGSDVITRLMCKIRKRDWLQCLRIQPSLGIE